ncbi:MAG: hypothetical protein ACYCZJ_00255 [Sulfuriferula sp.]
MSTDDLTGGSQPVPVEPPLSMRDLTTVLIKHYGIHEGRYDLLVEFQIGMGAVGPDPASLNPGAMIGVSKVGLMPAKGNGPTSVDAALVNPTLPSVAAKSKSTTALKKPSKTKSS